MKVLICDIQSRSSNRKREHRSQHHQCSEASFEILKELCDHAPGTRNQKKERKKLPNEQGPFEGDSRQLYGFGDQLVEQGRLQLQLDECGIVREEGRVQI